MKRIFTILTLAVSTVSAFAAVNPEDYPDLEPGKTYTLKFMDTFRGKYTPEADGQIIEYGTVPVWILKNDNLELLTEADGYVYAGHIKGWQSYQFPVKKGTTYYFEDDFVMNDANFMFEFNSGVEIIDMYPEADSVYDPAEMYDIEYFFNQNVKIGKATISIGSLSAEVETLINGATVSVLVNDVLRKWYNEDKIKGGEIITITLSNITDGLGNKIDEMRFTYKAAHKPVELTNAELPAVIYSWNSSDEPSKAVFVFSGPMAQNPNIELCYAPVELGYEYTEKIDATVEGNTITVDFGGKHRTSAEMSTSGRTDKNIFLILSSLRDESGQMVWSNGQGSVGSYMYEIPFVEIPSLNITSEFTPGNGASLKNAKTINIYFNCADHLVYSGVAFTSGEEKAVVNNDQITVERISDSEVELTVPVPAGWNDKDNVIVTLEGLTADDGYDHTADISAKFNGFTLLYCSIKDGARLKSLAEGAIIKVESNLSDDTKLTFEIAGVFGPEEMTAMGDGVFSFTMPSAVVFEIDETYTVNFTAVPGGTETLTIIGDTAPYEFSDLELVSISPEAGSEINAATEIKLTFTGMVSLTEMPQSAHFTATPVNEENSYYDYEWILKVADADSKNIVIAFSAMDMDYKVIKGNEGIDANSYFLFTFNIDESSISEIVNNNEYKTYDLQGRPVVSPRQGLFIRNGKIIRL